MSHDMLNKHVSQGDGRLLYQPTNCDSHGVFVSLRNKRRPISLKYFKIKSQYIKIEQ